MADATASAPDPGRVLRDIWAGAALEAVASPDVELPVSTDLLPSSFQVGLAAQASIAAAVSAAGAIYRQRSGANQRMRVARTAAERECTGYFRFDGEVPTAWEKFSGLYPTADGHVRIHANFDHHRDGVLRLLGLGDAEQTTREDVVRSLASWRAEDFETAAAERDLVVAMVRSFDEWDRHPQARASAGAPLVSLTRLDDATPLTLPRLEAAERPLAGIRVLELTRILAGPICGRTLAAYGADVLLVNSPELPNIAAIVDTSRGKRSAHLNLTRAHDSERLRALIGDAHLFVQGYRPGALAALGFSPEDVARIRPGIVYVSLSAYGGAGPWCERRGFDSLVQTATGFNHAEGVASGSDAPKPLPVQILDFASGFLMAFGAQAALLRQASEGGSWHVAVSLARTATWLRSLGRRTDGFGTGRPDLDPWLVRYPCSSGELSGMPHAGEFSRTPAAWTRPSVPPGTHPPAWA